MNKFEKGMKITTILTIFLCINVLYVVQGVHYVNQGRDLAKNSKPHTQVNLQLKSDIELRQQLQNKLPLLAKSLLELESNLKDRPTCQKQSYAKVSCLHSVIQKELSNHEQEALQERVPSTILDIVNLQVQSESEIESGQQAQFFGEIIRWIKCLFKDCQMEDAQKDHEEAERQRSNDRQGFDREINEAKRKDAERDKKQKEQQEKEQKEKEKQNQEEETAKTQQQRHENKNITAPPKVAAGPPQNNSTDSDTSAFQIVKLKDQIADIQQTLQNDVAKSENDKQQKTDNQQIAQNQSQNIAGFMAVSSESTSEYRRNGLMKEAEAKRKKYQEQLEQKQKELKLKLEELQKGQKKVQASPQKAEQEKQQLQHNKQNQTANKSQPQNQQQLVNVKKTAKQVAQAKRETELQEKQKKEAEALKKKQEKIRLEKEAKLKKEQEKKAAEDAKKPKSVLAYEKYKAEHKSAQEKADELLKSLTKHYGAVPKPKPPGEKSEQAQTQTQPANHIDGGKKDDDQSKHSDSMMQDAAKEVSKQFQDTLQDEISHQMNENPPAFMGKKSNSLSFDLDDGLSTKPQKEENAGPKNRASISNILSKGVDTQSLDAKNDEIINSLDSENFYDKVLNNGEFDKAKKAQEKEKKDKEDQKMKDDINNEEVRQMNIIDQALGKSEQRHHEMQQDPFSSAMGGAAADPFYHSPPQGFAYQSPAFLSSPVMPSLGSSDRYSLMEPSMPDLNMVMSTNNDQIYKPDVTQNGGVESYPNNQFKQAVINENMKVSQMQQQQQQILPGSAVAA